MKALLSVAPIALLAGCVFTPKLPPTADAELLTITKEPGECIGCERFELRVPSSGLGLLRVYRVHPCDHARCDGKSVLVRFEQLRLTPERYQAFRALLAPLRPVDSPAGDGYTRAPRGGCELYNSDSANYEVAWISYGPPAGRVIDEGCQDVATENALGTIDAAVASLGFKNPPMPSSGPAAPARVKP